MVNMTRTTPQKANRGAMAPMSKAISCPVMVVPILAPMITHTAWRSVIMREFTNPTTITVIAEEDCTTAVMPAPTITPKNRVGCKTFQNAFHSVAGSGFQTRNPSSAYHTGRVLNRPAASIRLRLTYLNFPFFLKTLPESAFPMRRIKKKSTTGTCCKKQRRWAVQC